MQPTMADIAKRAGVALSTVSYVLSGKRPISEAARQKVYQAMKDLSYQPNSLARALATRRTRIIALLYPSWSHDFDPQMEFVTSIVTSATDNGYALLLWRAMNEEQNMVNTTHHAFLDGAILMEVALEDTRVAQLQECMNH